MNVYNHSIVPVITFSLTIILPLTTNLLILTFIYTLLSFHFFMIQINCLYCKSSCYYKLLYSYHLMVHSPNHLITFGTTYCISRLFHFHHELWNILQIIIRWFLYYSLQFFPFVQPLQTLLETSFVSYSYYLKLSSPFNCIFGFLLLFGIKNYIFVTQILHLHFQRCKLVVPLYRNSHIICINLLLLF